MADDKRWLPQDTSTACRATACTPRLRAPRSWGGTHAKQAAAAAPAVVTLESFAAIYIERASQASGKQTWESARLRTRPAGLDAAVRRRAW